MIKVINSEQKKAGEINYTSVKFDMMGEQSLLLRSMENSDYLDLRIPEVISTHYP